MRVLYIDQTGKLGGGEIALLPWLDAARKDATVLLFEDGPFRARVEELGIHVEVVKSSALKEVRRESSWGASLTILPTLWRLRSQLVRLARNFDVLYANSQKAFLAAAISKGGGQPLVWHLRDILTAEHFSPMMRRLAVGMGNRFATVVIANSHATAEAFVEAGGSAAKVKVVHDGVSPLPFDLVGSDTVEQLRTEMGVGGETLVGLFGRLSPWKGQHIFLEAVSQLPEVHAALIGDALFGESEYVARLRTRANLPDLAGRVHFLGFRDNVPALMKSVDIIVHTSTAPEPFGLVIVEGMLARKPVVATDAGGAKEIVQDGFTGLLVPPGDTAALRSALERLVRDAELRTQLSDYGRRRAESVFSTDALVRGTSDVLRNVVASRNLQ